jgi:hypothetical protein
MSPICEALADLVLRWSFTIGPKQNKARLLPPQTLQLANKKVINSSATSAFRLYRFRKHSPDFDQNTSHFTTEPTVDGTYITNILGTPSLGPGSNPLTSSCQHARQRRIPIHITGGNPLLCPQNLHEDILSSRRPLHSSAISPTPFTHQFTTAPNHTHPLRPAPPPDLRNGDRMQQLLHQHSQGKQHLQLQVLCLAGPSSRRYSICFLDANSTTDGSVANVGTALDM